MSIQITVPNLISFKLHFLLLSDVEIAKEIGLQDAAVGDLHIIVKKSKMSYGKSTHEVAGTKLFA